MPAILTRPTFFEGQILGAGDLSGIISYARAHDARHQRYLHLWGLVWGLTGKVDGEDLLIEPGLAVDSSGKQVLVTEQRRLGMSEFKDQLSSNEKEGFYPVYLVARQERGPKQQALGRCASGDQVRIDERFDIQFDRLARARDWDDQTPPPVGDGPDDTAVSSRRILLGFVELSKSGKFRDFVLEADSIRPRYVGVRAETMTSPGGRVFLRTREAGTTDAPVLILDESSEDQTLSFGMDDGKGNLKDPPALTVDTKGNLTVTGSIRGLTAGTVLMESGTITDGTTLPLPTGITQKQIDNASAILHHQVTPRIDWTGALPEEVPFVVECFVDDKRRLRCIVGWKNLGNPPGEPMREVPGTADYTIVATVPSA